MVARLRVRRLALSQIFDTVANALKGIRHFLLPLAISPGF